MFWAVKYSFTWADVREFASPIGFFQISSKIPNKQMFGYSSESLCCSTPLWPWDRQCRKNRPPFVAMFLFVEFDLSWKIHTVQCCFCFGVICVDPWFATCVDIIHFHLVSFPYLFAPIETKFLWTLVRLSVVQRKQIFFSRTILLMPVIPIPEDGSCSIGLLTASMFFGTTNRLDYFHGIRPGLSLYQYFTVL